MTFPPPTASTASTATTSALSAAVAICNTYNRDKFIMPSYKWTAGAIYVFWIQYHSSSIAFTTIPRQGIQRRIHDSSTQRHQQQPQQQQPRQEDEQRDEWNGFNPLEPRTNGNRNRLAYSSTRISLRKAKMQTLTEGLLECSTNPEAMQQLLIEQQDFVLEPILDLEAPLDDDSIFLGQSTVEKRFIAYQSEMEERISKAKSGNAKKVLIAMMEFVMLHQQHEQQKQQGVGE